MPDGIEDHVNWKQQTWKAELGLVEKMLERDARNCKPKTWSPSAVPQLISRLQFTRGITGAIFLLQDSRIEDQMLSSSIPPRK
jgi:hypothetical protein